MLLTFIKITTSWALPYILYIIYFICAICSQQFYKEATLFTSQDKTVGNRIHYLYSTHGERHLKGFAIAPNLRSRGWVGAKLDSKAGTRTPMPVSIVDKSN